MNKFLIIISAIYLLMSTSVISNPKIDVKTAILIDYDSNEVIYELEPDMSIYPASMTKIMTAIIVFDMLKENKLDMDDKLQFQKRHGDCLKVDTHLCF